MNIEKNHTGNLDLSFNTGITSLPDGLTVGASLDLTGCTGITSLPDGLNLGEWLYLEGCTGLTSLPDGLTVGASLYLTGCTNIIPAETNAGNDKRSLYPFLNGGEWKISLGCFMGTEEEAIRAIRKKYGQNSNYERKVINAFQKAENGELSYYN
jgi:hypothetical protein